MILEDGVRRIGIYFFYDREGIVDDYAVVMLKAMNPYLDYCLFVANGELTQESRGKLDGVVSDVLVRENRGFDVWAYKEGLEHIGWDEIGDYDELILFNFTVMGPINPLSDMFEEMDRRDLDFWGITKYYEQPGSDMINTEYGFIPEHLQSFFIAVRKSMLTDRSFRYYWDNLPEISTYTDAVTKHEAVFTKRFSEAGFLWDAYVQTDDLKDKTVYPLIFLPQELAENRKCPFFKRKLFYQEYKDLIGASLGNSSEKFMRYLRRSGSFDLDLIWDNILRTCHMDDISRLLKLYYTIPRDMHVEKDAPAVSGKKIPVVIELNDKNCIDMMFEIIRTIPGNTEVHIITNTREMESVITGRLHDDPRGKDIDVRQYDNDGIRYILSDREEITDSDYICLISDGVITDDHSIGAEYSFLKHYIRCVIGYDEGHVNCIVRMFEDNKRLGMLLPTRPLYGRCQSLIANEWEGDHKEVLRMTEKLGLHVPISEAHVPMAPYYGICWVRTGAVRRQGRNETLPDDILGLRRPVARKLLPFIVQDNGYYMAAVNTEMGARADAVAMDHCVRVLQKSYSTVELFSPYESEMGERGSWRELIDLRDMAKMKHIQTTLSYQFFGLFFRIHIWLKKNAREKENDK